MSECQTCGATTADASLCNKHVQELRHLLAQIPDRLESVKRNHLDAYDHPTGVRDDNGNITGPIIYRKTIPGIATELQTTITRQDKLGVVSSTATTGEKALEWNDTASIIEVELNATINAWALDVSKHDEDPRDPLANYPHTDLPAVADWLRRNVTTLAQLPDAGRGYSEISNAIGRAKKAIDRPKNRTKFLVGPCPETPDDTPCPGEVWAYIPTSETDPALMHCQNPDCGATWNTTQWLRAAKRILTKVEELRQQGIRFPYTGVA